MHATNRSAQECAQSSSSDAAAAKGPAKYVVPSLRRTTRPGHVSFRRSRSILTRCTDTRTRSHKSHPPTSITLAFSSAGSRTSSGASSSGKKRPRPRAERRRARSRRATAASTAATHRRPLPRAQRTCASLAFELARAGRRKDSLACRLARNALRGIPGQRASRYHTNVYITRRRGEKTHCPAVIAVLERRQQRLAFARWSAPRIAS
jgi:hypothetical protein